MAEPAKDTIYIDIDDEITTIIDKVRGSNQKIVALVLPKRATVLQSIVNMKLLKHSADKERKSLVLITAEAGLLPLAGTVGLYVAKTLQSKPEVPAVQSLDDEAISADEDEPISMPAEEITAETAGDTPVGELAAGRTPAAAKKKATPKAVDAEDIETVALDDELDAAPDVSDTATEADKPKKGKKTKKDGNLAVPNFNRFRAVLFIGLFLLVVLIAGIVVAAKVLPKAQVTLNTDTSNINSSLTFTASKSATTLDATNMILPAQIESTQKQQSQSVSTTGKKNNGTPSSGMVTITNCSQDGSELDIPSGTGVSGGGYTFITQTPVAITNSAFFGASCKANVANSKTTVKVVAQTPGNITVNDGTTMSVAGFTAASAAANGDINGGTDNIVQVVAQADIDNATQKLAAQDASSVRTQLDSQLKSAGYFPIDATFTAAAPTTTNSANVGDQASTVTVTQTTSYTLFGVKENDLKTLVDTNVKSQIDPSKQTILSEGLSGASFHVNSATGTTAQIAMSTTAVAGPDLKADQIKSQIVGMKAGQVQDTLKSDPGVTNVNVKLSPFWVTQVPKNLSKVTVTFEKSQ